MASSRVSFRARFDNRLAAKENKDALKNTVQEALAELGLAIDDDEGDVKFHHLKLVRKKNKKPKFVVMGLTVAEGESMDRMKASAAFAEGGDGSFTVRWGETMENAASEEPDGGLLPGRKTGRTDTTTENRANDVTTEKRARGRAREISSSSLYSHEHRASSMTSTLLAGVVCAVGLAGALLMGYHHRGLFASHGARWGRAGR